MNRHMKIALIMAPVLALIAYGLTGYFQPKKERIAGVYELRLIDECRPINSRCLMKSGDFEINLVSSMKKGQQQLAIVSNQPLSYFSMALAEKDREFNQFKVMKSDGQKYWQIVLAENQKIDTYTRFRLAGNSEKSDYFIEADLVL